MPSRPLFLFSVAEVKESTAADRHPGAGDLLSAGSVVAARGAAITASAGWFPDHFDFEQFEAEGPHPIDRAVKGGLIDELPPHGRAGFVDRHLEVVEGVHHGRDSLAGERYFIGSYAHQMSFIQTLTLL
jgi:hypothetical protein